MRKEHFNMRKHTKSNFKPFYCWTLIQFATQTFSLWKLSQFSTQKLHTGPSLCELGIIRRA